MHVTNFKSSFFIGAAVACSFVFCSVSPSLADDLAAGKAVYEGAGACGTCHGPQGAGDGPAGAALTPKPRSFVTGDYSIDTDGDGTKGTETDIYNIVTNGAQKYGGSMMMVGRPDLSEENRHALAKYVLSLKK